MFLSFSLARRVEEARQASSPFSRPSMATPDLRSPLAVTWRRSSLSTVQYSTGYLEEELLVYGGARPYWAALGRLDLQDLGGGVAATEHGDVDILDDAHADLLHRLEGSVADDEGALDVVPVMVKLLVQSGLQLQLALGEQEVLPHRSGWLTALLGGGKLHLPY